MNSFRNRLLAVIIGLVVVTQSVTLVAVLASTNRDVRARADEQLRSGGRVVQQYIHFRADQLANTVAVLAADFGFRAAFASGDAATLMSAATNHSSRIGADLVLLADTKGRLLASNSPDAQADAVTAIGLLTQAEDAPEQARFGLLGGHLYQFFITPVRAPDTIGWVALGFAVDNGLARRLSDLVGVEVSLTARDPATGHDVRVSTLRATTGDYLSHAFDLGTAPPVRVLLQKPMDEVLAPYRAQRNALLLIGGIALLLATGFGLLLGRGAARPIGDLVRAARRIEAGSYEETVEVRGGEEFSSLAATFNVMQRNIADREERIRHAADHDALTGLPSLPRAERHLEELLRQQPAAAALIGLEVMNLGEINAFIGHRVGDKSLREAARRLRDNCGPAEFVARIDTSRFLVIARDCTSVRAPLLAEQLAGILRAELRLDFISLELHVSAGVCCAPEHGASVEELLRHMHTALEDSHESRGHVTLYHPGRDAHLRRRLTLAGDLHGAIERDELSLVFQPKLDLARDQVHSFEALVRWTHPQLGCISPAEFVPVAEQTGGTRQLTSWVLVAAIRQMSAWRRADLDVDVAVNLSAPDLLDPLLGDEILAALKTYDVPATRLVLEITESAVMRDPALAVHHMQRLRAAGVRFSLDDFGTGYSSLSQLSQLPLDELKIDRSFILRVHDPRGDAIVMSTIKLAHKMGLKVVAEGVEMRQTCDLLRDLGCDLIQGWLVSKALSPEDAAAFLRQGGNLTGPEAASPSAASR